MALTAGAKAALNTIRQNRGMPGLSPKEFRKQAHIAFKGGATPRHLANATSSDPWTRAQILQQGGNHPDKPLYKNGKAIKGSPGSTKSGE